MEVTMGWGRALLLGNIGAQMNVEDVERDVEELRNYLRSEQKQHHSTEAKVAALQRENHELKLYFATLIRLLRTKNVLTPEEVQRFVDLLDRGDGVE
jgi:hypothetical protein